MFDACEVGDEEKVKAILAIKGDPAQADKLDLNWKDKNGVTALMWGSQNGHVDVVQALLAAGARVDRPTALMLTLLAASHWAG